MRACSPLTEWGQRQGLSRRQTFAQAVTSRRSHRRLLPWRPIGRGKSVPRAILLARWWVTPRMSATSMRRMVGVLATGSKSGSKPEAIGTRACISAGQLARPTGFDPAISALTGR